jgi:N-acetylglucosamine kinase-like BadF-type ATPase
VAYYLGIDGGASKTRCAVGDEISQLSAVTGGPSNVTRVGEVRVRESLHQVIREACAVAKIAPQQVQRACIGAAGAGREGVANAIRRIVAELIPGEIHVVGDMPIALTAAFGSGPGVVVIAGTGSFAYGRNRQGRTARAGGWGFAISDEGSAHWIGRTAVSALLRAIDLRPVDQEEEDQRAIEALPLFREAKAAWKVASLDEVVRTANSNPDFAALLPAILATADAGDPLAEYVLAQAGGELARLAGIVARQLFKRDDAKLPAIPLALAGGVFRHSRRVSESFCDEIRKLDMQFELRPQVVEPVAGALQMARASASAAK